MGRDARRRSPRHDGQPRVLLVAITALAACIYTLPGASAQAPVFPVTQHIEANDGGIGDGFGWGVATAGDVIATSAMGRTANALYVIERPAQGPWGQVRVDPELGHSGSFGRSIGAFGDIVAVGDIDDLGGRGSVHVFTRNGDQWSQQKLTASDGSTSDLFGHDLAVGDGVVAVGVRYEDNENGTNAGAVYVYTREGGGWSEEKLIAPDGGPHQNYGSSVAIAGSRLIVGASQDDGLGTAAGAVWVHERAAGGAWIGSKLTASEGTSGDRFGSAVVADETRIVVGAPHDDPVGTNSGAVYVYDATGAGGWIESKLVRSGGAADEQFGAAVALGDGWAAGSGTFSDHGPGPVSVFLLDDGRWNEIEVVTANPGGNAPATPIASLGAAIVVGWPGGDTRGDRGEVLVIGSGRFTDDDFSLHEPNIEAIAVAGISRGCNPPLNDHFCPDDPTTRGELAALLDRALALPEGDPERFTDTAGSIFRDSIGSLATAGITRGCNPPLNNRFCPDRRVSRGEAAAFLARAFALARPTGTNRFIDDDGSLFERDIEALAAAGITLGCDPPAYDRFCPQRLVTRAEMASLLARAMELRP